MNTIKVIHDTTRHTLTVWVGDPAKKSIREETTDAVVLMKDAQGHVLGFEIPRFKPEKPEAGLSVEMLVRA